MNPRGADADVEAGGAAAAAAEGAAVSIDEENWNPMPLPPVAGRVWAAPAIAMGAPAVAMGAAVDADDAVNAAPPPSPIKLGSAGAALVVA